MDIRILGRLEVYDGDRPIDVSRPMERALLTILGAQVGEVVSTDRLVDGLWGEDLPATATKTLQTYVHHLRSLLPPGAIATEGSGYRLAVDPADVDACRFEDTVERGRARLDADPAVAAALLAAALDTWRGEPAADAQRAEWLRPVRVKLEGMRLRATTDLIDARIRMGQHREAIPQLRALVEEHPLREDLWGLLMLALYRSGRQAEALRAFTTARNGLAEELGVEPGPELRRLEALILAQDASLLPDPHPIAEAEPAAEPVVSQPQAVERRLTTLVLAQLDGAKELRIAVTPRTADKILEEAVRVIGSVVESLGGTIVDRDEAGLVGSYGTPIAREDDAYRAVRAALSVRAELARQSKEVERSWGSGGIAYRVAVLTVPVTTPFGADGDVDDHREELARLAAAGRAGDVVVDDHTHRLIRELFWWDDGDGDVGPAWRVRGVRGEPGKARVGRRLRSPLFGRETELAVATEALQALGRGVGGVLVVLGDAGVGKTRLLEEIREFALQTDVQWMVGHCASYAEAIPYRPLRDLVRSWLDLGVDDTELKTRVTLAERLDELDPQVARDLSPYLGGLLGVMPESGEAGRLQLAPEALQYRTFEVVRELFGALARRRPLVAGIEDIHWADPTSLQLLEQMLTLTETEPLLLVLTARPDPDHPSHRLRDTARRAIPHLLREVTLDVLGDDAQQAMLQALVGAGTLPAAMTRKLLNLAEGNPFYLEELIGALIDEGALVPGDHGWEFDHDVALTVPETVEKVVQARIDRLRAPVHHLVTSASVLGRRFGLPLLQGVVGEAESVVEALHELLRLDLLVEARRWPQAEYVFKHALIQEAAYRTLPAARRNDLHRSAAEWLERRHQSNEDEVAGLLARHWAATGDEVRAIGALITAGDLARRDHALDEAIEHYRTLLPMLERRGDHQTMALVLLKLGLALHTALRFAESNATYQRAFELWEPSSGVEATEVLRFAGPPFYRPGDPIRSYFLPDMQLQMALFDRLVERWPDDTLVPSLADRWEVSDDGLRYRFTLRPDLTWSDGHPLTAHDAAYGVLRNLDPARPGISVAMLYAIEGAKEAVLEGAGFDRVGIEAIDDRTVEFRLVAPAPYFLSMLNRPDCGPQPRHAIEARGNEWATADNEVVSGAFHRSHHSDDRVVLERRPDYQGHRTGNVMTVDWAVTAYDAAIGEYLAGRGDLMWISGGWDGAAAKTLPAGQVHFEPPAGLVYVIFDHAHPRVGDARFRLGLAHAVDRDALRHVLPEHAWPAHGGVVPPALAGHTPDIAPRFDPERGRELCAGGGSPAGLRFAVVDRPGHFFIDLAQAVGEMWRSNLDVDVAVDTFDPATYSGLAPADRPALFISSWYPGYTDPEYFLRLLLHSEAADNFGRFAHEAFDELVDSAALERDERRRLALFHAADRMAVAEQVAVIPLAYNRNISVRSPAVSGWWEFGKSWSNFADLTIERH